MSSSNQGPVGALRMVGIDVGDLDRAKQFWGEMLGLEEESRGPEYLLFVQAAGRAYRIPSKRAGEKDRQEPDALRHRRRGSGCRRRPGP